MIDVSETPLVWLAIVLVVALLLVAVATTGRWRVMAMWMRWRAIKHYEAITDLDFEDLEVSDDGLDS